jgi:RluA family pseudouridine synthase
LKPGDLVEILTVRAATAEKLKKRLAFKLIYEDAHVIVVDKPAGLLTMGTETEKEDTVYFQLTDYVRTESGNDRARIFIVHRLDRDTSGLLVFAKTEEAKHFLQENWERAVKKYYAVTEKVPSPKRGKIESFLVENDFRQVYSVRTRSRDAKHAVTHYSVLKEKGRYALVDVALETGRKNQIRVHMADIGCPVAGDAKYGAVTDPFGRLGLHAYYLSFPHPNTGAMKTFRSEPDFL